MANGKIIQLKELDDLSTPIYPVTKADAVYLQNGSLLTDYLRGFPQTTIGAANQPIYLNNGVLTAGDEVYSKAEINSLLDSKTNNDGWTKVLAPSSTENRDRYYLESAWGNSWYYYNHDWCLINMQIMCVNPGIADYNIGVTFPKPKHGSYQFVPLGPDAVNTGVLWVGLRGDGTLYCRAGVANTWYVGSILYPI